MPKRKRSYAPKRNVRRARRTFKKRTRIVRMPRPMRPRTYNFVRSFVETVSLNSTTPPAGWLAVDQGLVRSQPFSLSMLPQYSEFQTLFAQYRIMAVKQEYYFSDNVSGSVVDGTNVNSANKQIIMYTTPNAQGVNNAANLTENFFMQSQCCKKRLCLNTQARPVKVYTKLKQLSRIYSGELGNQDFIKVSPKFVSTTEAEAQHYGLDMRIQRVDGNNFSTGGSNYPSVKIITKMYMQTRQVK